MEDIDEDDDYLNIDSFVDNHVNKFQKQEEEEKERERKREKYNTMFFPQHKKVFDIDIKNCHKCNDIDSIITVGYEKVCKTCGDIIERNDLDSGPEWNNYEDTSSRNYINPRCGTAINPFLPKMSMTTTLNCRGNRRLAYSLHVTMQKWNTPYNESAKYQVFNRTIKICERAGFLKKVVNDTITMLNTVIEHKELCGKVRRYGGNLCDKHEKLYNKKFAIKVELEKQKDIIAKRSMEELIDELGRLEAARNGEINILPLACNVASSVFGRGECRDSLIAACIYHSCLLNNAERTEEEIASIMKLDTGKMTTGFQQFKNIMRLNRDYRKSMEKITQKLHCNYINKFSQKLELSFEQQTFVKVIYDIVIDEGILDGRTPQTLTSTCFYVTLCILNKDPNVSEYNILCNVSKKCDVSTHTIKSTSEMVFTYIVAKLFPETIKK